MNIQLKPYQSWIFFILAIIGFAFIVAYIWVIVLYNKIKIVSKGTCTDCDGKYKQVTLTYKGDQYMVSDKPPLEQITKGDFKVGLNENGALVISKGKKTKTIPYEEIVTGPLEI